MWIHVKKEELIILQIFLHAIGCSHLFLRLKWCEAFLCGFVGWVFFPTLPCSTFLLGQCWNWILSHLIMSWAELLVRFKTNPVGTEDRFLRFPWVLHNHKAWSYSGSRLQIKEFLGFWLNLVKFGFNLSNGTVNSIHLPHSLQHVECWKAESFFCEVKIQIKDLLERHL